MAALIAQYPGLQRAYDAATRSFDDLIAAHPVEFHAAYIANLEATFTPLFKVILIRLLVDEFSYRGPGGRRRKAQQRGPATLFGTVPTGDLAKMVWRLALSQMPNHNPAAQPLPAWADTWMAEYDRGTDMTSFTHTTDGAP